MRIRSLLAPALLASLAAPVSAAVVHVVDASGGGDFTTIQAAVDAAADGDLILVRATATYAGFTVDGKALAIVREGPDLVHVAGTVEVEDLPAAGTLLLGGFEVQGASSHQASLVEPALVLTGDAGGVRVQNSRLLGGNCTAATDFTPPSAPPAVVIARSSDVAFASCEIRGGTGGGISFLWLDSIGGNGGHGISGTASRVALYDTTSTGGRGGDGALWSGDGGHGVRLASGELFAAGSACVGALPGDAWGNDAYHFGTSGHGLFVAPQAKAVLLDTTVVATTGGAGPVTLLSGGARILTVPDANDPALGVRVTARGVPGDRVYLAHCRASAFHLQLAWSGVLLLAVPVLASTVSVGTIPASGVLYFDAPLAPLALGETHRVELAQGFVVGADGRPYLGSPLGLVRVP